MIIVGSPIELVATEGLDVAVVNGGIISRLSIQNSEEKDSINSQVGIRATSTLLVAYANEARDRGGMYVWSPSGGIAYPFPSGTAANKKLVKSTVDAKRYKAPAYPEANFPGSLSSIVDNKDKASIATNINQADFTFGNITETNDGSLISTIIEAYAFLQDQVEITDAVSVELLYEGTSSLDAYEQQDEAKIEQEIRVVSLEAVELVDTANVLSEIVSELEFSLSEINDDASASCVALWSIKDTVQTTTWEKVA